MHNDLFSVYTTEFLTFCKYFSSEFLLENMQK